MKAVKIVLIVVVVLGLVFFALRTYTKSHSPEEKISSDHDGLTIHIDYCRPYKKGRVIFGGLVPYGQVWRTGANEATMIRFEEDVKVAGKELKAGAYTLWTIPTASNWTVIFNGETGQWGTQYDEKKDILRVEVPSSKTPETVEQFKIEVIDATNGADLVMKWENTSVAVPIRKQ